MPDGRFLSKSISHNEQLAQVSIEAALLFTWCIPHLDREGRMPGHPALVKAIACPVRPEITEARVPDLLRELGRVGLIRWYEADGKQVIEFPGFKHHQKGAKLDRESPSRLPGSDSHGARDLLRTYSGVTPDLLRSNSGPTPDLLRSNSGPTPELVRLSEVEVKLSSSLSTDASHPAPGGADVENPADGGRPAGTDRDRTAHGGQPSDAEIHATLAPLIREHLWRGSRPPPDVLRADAKWSMSRELHLAKQLMRECGLSLQEMAGAISVCRDVLYDDAPPRDMPVTLRYLCPGGRTARLRLAVHQWRKREEQKNGPGLASVGEILRAALQAN